jgi:hypothetical protein
VLHCCYHSDDVLKCKLPGVIPQQRSDACRHFRGYNRQHPVTGLPASYARRLPRLMLLLLLLPRPLMTVALLLI